MDEVFVRINWETHYLWRAVDHEGEALEVFATKHRDRRAALKFLKRIMKRHGQPWSIVTDGLRSYGAAMKVIGNQERQEYGRWFLTLPSRSPELNPVENIWQFMRDDWPSNRAFKSHDDIVDHCCDAWNKLVDQPWKIMSIGHREWAYRS